MTRRSGFLSSVIIAFSLHLVAYENSCFGQARETGPEFLAATSNDDDLGGGYPATIYGAISRQKLSDPREIVPAGKGIVKVIDGVKSVYLVVPVPEANTVVVIPKARPTAFYSVPLPTGFGKGWVIAAPLILAFHDKSRDGLLLPFLHFTDYKSDIEFKLYALVEKTDHESDVIPALPELYHSIVWNYVPAGPSVGSRPICIIDGDEVFLQLGSGKLIFDKLAGVARSKLQNRSRLELVFADESRRGYVAQRTRDDADAGKLGSSTELFVHDLRKDTWSRVIVPGNVSFIRAYGPWVCARVGQWTQTGQYSASAEGSNESDLERNIEGLYNDYQSHIQSSGALFLHNLDDNHELNVNTGYRDSEILAVQNNVVLYRTETSLHTATISGDQFGSSAIIAQDPDIVQIHWVLNR